MFSCKIWTYSFTTHHGTADSLRATTNPILVEVTPRRCCWEDPSKETSKRLPWNSPQRDSSEILPKETRGHPKRLEVSQREVTQRDFAQEEKSPKRLRAKRVCPKRLCSLINRGLLCTCVCDQRLSKATQTPWCLWTPAYLWVTSKGTALTGLHPWMKSSLYLHLRRSRGWRSSTLD